jgi:hypothetical protein
MKVSNGIPILLIDLKKLDEAPVPNCMIYRSRFVILKWISDLRLNFNHQLIYIDYLIDISINKGKSTADVMDEDRFLRLLKEKDLNTPQRH